MVYSADAGSGMDEGREQAVFYRDEVKAAMDALRAPVDRLVGRLFLYGGADQALGGMDSLLVSGRRQECRRGANGGVRPGSS